MAHTATIPADLDALKRGWMFVGKTFQEMSPHCDDCSHCDHSGEMRPYGEGQAFEAICECKLGQRASDKPEMCPAYREHLEQQLNTTERSFT